LAAAAGLLRPLRRLRARTDGGPALHEFLGKRLQYRRRATCLGAAGCGCSPFASIAFVTETAVSLEQQLEEIGTQLAWVRDYL
jgi:hypothetical protein